MRSRDELLIPFWEGNTVYDESVLFLSENEQNPFANLFFKPKDILRVCSSNYEKEYVRGVDWKEQDGKLYLLEGTGIPSMKMEQLHFYSDETQDSFAAKDGGRILYKTKGFFHKKQILVTYRHEEQWRPSKSILGSRALEKLKEKTEHKENITICFYGDSITAGCDGSKLMGLAPYQESWPRLVAEELEKTCGCAVQYINTSVGGMQSDWGLENAQQRVADYNPDVVVLAFGMNDGTEQVPSDVFKHNIMGIMNCILEKNKDTEFILIATTVANPESVFDGCQREYVDVLSACMDDGDILLI